MQLYYTFCSIALWRVQWTYSIALLGNGTFSSISRDHNQPIKRSEFNGVLYNWASNSQKQYQEAKPNRKGDWSGCLLDEEEYNCNTLPLCKGEWSCSKSSATSLLSTRRTFLVQVATRQSFREIHLLWWRLFAFRIQRSTKANIFGLKMCAWRHTKLEWEFKWFSLGPMSKT